MVIHAITDGRDVAPDSAAGFMADLHGALPEGARIGTVIGRYWAMDRDNRWERVARAYGAMVHGEGDAAPDAAAAVAASYAKGETDEFIAPTVIGDYAGVKDGDGLFLPELPCRPCARNSGGTGRSRALTAFDTGPSARIGRRCWGWWIIRPPTTPI